MNTFKKILVGFAVLAGLMAAGSYFIPTHYEIEQSVVIAAPADRIYPWVADLKKWNEWNAFALQDPETKYTFSGAESGAGAVSSWISPQMGAGTQTITRAEPAEGVEFELLFDGKYKMNGKVSFFAADGGGTRVTWFASADNSLNPVHRWMSLIGKKMMNTAFQKSLQTLKAKVETAG